jgi:hypothetical protein
MSQARLIVPGWEVPYRPDAVNRSLPIPLARMPSGRSLLWIGIATAVVVTLAAAGLGQVFVLAERNEIHRKQLEPTNPVLQATRAEERLRLERYQWVDRSQSVLRIPVARARELVLTEYSRPSAASSASLSASGGGGPATSNGSQP